MTEGRGSPLESTAVLLGRVREGDERSRDLLLDRYLPVLRRWAHGRLPDAARGVLDTDDMVQVTLLKVLDNIDGIVAEREGSFLAYLRAALLNALRDEMRRCQRRPGHEELGEDVAAVGPTVVEEVIGRQLVQRYESAIEELNAPQREAVIMRLEFGYSFAEIASAVGCPTANAARMMVSRAVLRLGEVIGGPPGR